MQYQNIVFNDSIYNSRELKAQDEKGLLNMLQDLPITIVSRDPGMNKIKIKLDPPQIRNRLIIKGKVKIEDLTKIDSKKYEIIYNTGSEQTLVIKERGKNRKERRNNREIVFEEYYQYE
jgi:hypothetical protein